MKRKYSKHQLYFQVCFNYSLAKLYMNKNNRLKLTFRFLYEANVTQTKATLEQLFVRNTLILYNICRTQKVTDTVSDSPKNNHARVAAKDTQGILISVPNGAFVTCVNKP